MRPMRWMWQVAAVGLISVMAAACTATRPTKYYALDTPATPTSTQAPLPVGLVVGHVTASQLYRGSRLVYGWGPVELGTYEYHRWAEPPVDFLQTMLVNDLRASGRYRSVTPVGSFARGDYIVLGHLDALDEIDKPALAARFTFQLSLLERATGSIVWSSSYNHDEPVQGKQVSDVVAALGRNVEAGLGQLTAGLYQYLANRPPQ